MPLSQSSTVLSYVVILIFPTLTGLREHAAISEESIYNHFTKTVKDNFLWQMVDFPTRANNILDLVLTTIPEKIINLQGFDDILDTDHKLISFDINFKIQRKVKVKRSTYNFKKANWPILKELLGRTPWDLCFVSNDVDESLSNWHDMFISAVNEHIPKCTLKNVNEHPWIDAELRSPIRKKNNQRNKLRRSQSPVDLEKYKLLRRITKQLIAKKRKDHATKMKDSVFESQVLQWSGLTI